MAKGVRTQKRRSPFSLTLVKQRIDPRISKINNLDRQERFLDEMIEKKVAYADRVIRLYDKSARRLI